MARLGDIVQKVRSKNAGPFWLTVDIFCGSPEAYSNVVENLQDEQVAQTFGIATQTVKRFEIPDLQVVKFSIPRPTTQGSIRDRDMHGASWAALLASVDI